MINILHPTGDGCVHLAMLLLVSTVSTRATPRVLCKLLHRHLDRSLNESLPNTGVILQ